MLILVRAFIMFYTGAIIIYAILGWVVPAGYSPPMALLASICEPLLAPIRRVIPPIGGIDLSPFCGRCCCSACCCGCFTLLDARLIAKGGRDRGNNHLTTLDVESTSRTRANGEDSYSEHAHCARRATRASVRMCAGP